MSQWFWMNRLSKQFNDSLIDNVRTAKFQYQEWQLHLNKGLNPLNYQSVCVRNTTLSWKCDNLHHCNHCVSLKVFLTKGILQRLISIAMSSYHKHFLGFVIWAWLIMRSSYGVGQIGEVAMFWSFLNITWIYFSFCSCSLQYLATQMSRGKLNCWITELLYCVCRLQKRIKH